MNLVATLKYRKTLRGSRSRIAGARRNGEEVCRAHFVQTVTFRRLCPPKELSDGQSGSSVFRQGSFNTASRSPQSMQLAKGSTPMSSPTPPPRSTPTAALRRPKPPGDLPASTCALPRTCSSPSTDANTTHQSLKAAPVSRLGRPFSLLATGGVGFCPASTHPIRRTEGGKGGVRGGQLNEILVSEKASTISEYTSDRNKSPPYH